MGTALRVNYQPAIKFGQELCEWFECYSSRSFLCIQSVRTTNSGYYISSEYSVLKFDFCVDEKERMAGDDISLLRGISIVSPFSPVGTSTTEVASHSFCKFALIRRILSGGGNEEFR